ncbi:hypothetical protein QQF64_016563 [Cirrhinus molitorella]|uniref:Uncharacterized protein n=1 Tax=Cirrhinus molitorella TaxID=172907 RepID=A0ABR3LRE7_9TELE
MLAKSRKSPDLAVIASGSNVEETFEEDAPEAEALSLEKPPHVDRANRALRARPGSDEPPRAFILRLHYVHEMEEITQRRPGYSRLSLGAKESISFQTIHLLW